MAQQTPVQKAGYKVGDKFIVLAGSVFEEGSEITLARDDGSSCPMFTGETCRFYNGPGGSKGGYLELTLVQPELPRK